MSQEITATKIIDPGCGVEVAPMNGKQVLAGYGTRALDFKIFKVSLYSVAAYVDEKQIRKELSQCKDKKDSGSFEKDLINSVNVDKSLVLTMARAIPNRKIIDPLTRTIKTRMDTLNEEDGEKFKALLLKGMKGRTGVKRNNTFTFATSSNTLTIKVNGEESGKIVSPVLCKALWTLYLTEKTPSKSARDKICQGVKSML